MKKKKKKKDAKKKENLTKVLKKPAKQEVPSTTRKWHKLRVSRGSQEPREKLHHRVP